MTHIGNCMHACKNRRQIKSSCDALVLIPYRRDGGEQWETISYYRGAAALAMILATKFNYVCVYRAFVARTLDADNQSDGRLNSNWPFFLSGLSLLTPFILTRGPIFYVFHLLVLLYADIILSACRANSNLQNAFDYTRNGWKTLKLEYIQQMEELVFWQNYRIVIGNTAIPVVYSCYCMSQ